MKFFGEAFKRDPLKSKAKMNRGGYIIIAGVVISLIILFTYLLLLQNYYAPAYLTVRPAYSITKYPNGTTVVNPALQFGNGGLAVLMLPNGSQYVFNVTNIKGFMELYKVAPWAFINLNEINARVLIVPNALRGWVMIRGVNITLTYYFYNYRVINGSSLEITYVLSGQVISEINRTSPDMLKYVPYAINLLIMRPGESGDNIIWTGGIEWDLEDAFGLTVARADQYVQYETDCVSGIYWATGWIDTGGVPGYTFYNQITIGSETWSGWGSLTAPQITFSPPVFEVQVKESTSFYFGVNENGYGVYGQIASGTTTWDLFPTEVYYVASGTAILNSPSSSGTFNVCS